MSAAALALAAISAAQEPAEHPAAAARRSVPPAMTFEQAEPALERALTWLVDNQHPSGAWATGAVESLWEDDFSVETYYAWQVASQALAVLALLRTPETPERRAALERGVDWLVTTRLPKRGSDWDVDYVWSILYGLVAALEVSGDARFAGAPWAERVERRGRELYGLLERNQVPDGGWAYYDDPPFTRRPKWATSFCTALILPYVERALERGWGTDRAVLERAITYVRRCALPSGAYAYSLRILPRGAGESIDGVKGSLGRIQVCNWGLARSGDERITEDRLRAGLEAFFEHHRFLDAARMRPIPHEAYYANAGYFYLFAHYYAAEAIELLPPAEREGLHARLRPHLVKVQEASGSSTDFLGTGYLDVAGTAYTALALELGRTPSQ